MNTSNFTISDYSNLPYLNIDADDAEPEKITLKLSELFEYQKLTIPAAATPPPPPSTAAAAPIPGAPTPSDPEYHILNIKKQFICVKFKEAGNEKSRIYVKKPTITYPLDKLHLISIDNKTILGEIVFDEKAEATAKSAEPPDTEGLAIFKKVYD